MRSVLIATRRSEEAKALKSSLQRDYRVKHTPSRQAALEVLKQKRFDVLFIDLELLVDAGGETDSSRCIEPFKSLYPGIEIVVVAPPREIRRAVTIVKAGASNYLTYPHSVEEAELVVETLEKSLLRQSELDYLRSEFWKADALELIQTRNPVMQQVFHKIRSVAPTRTTVLLTGETGTGKGVLAKLVHRHSNRHQAQFISVHCGAIPDTLLESELFGHEKGAFTGAVKKKLGKFEIAKGGTIFLDEIGTITPSAQIKLLQVLQDGTFSRVGGEETIETDARVIAATNLDLHAACESGSFRKDLYYRLNVFPIEIPPLRERVEDLPFLSEVLLRRLDREMQKGITRIDPRLFDHFARYTWPGNIRELENLLERAYILESGAALTPQTFPSELVGGMPAGVDSTALAHLPLSEARQRAVEDFERQYLRDLLERSRGRINRAAEAAGVSTRQLHKLLTRYGIRKEAYKA